MARIGVRTAALALVWLVGIPAHAGFLDFPEVTQTQPARQESLLKDMAIPSVRERSPDPQAGPYLAVSAFRLQGIVEFPELGITREKLIDMIESIRFEMMDENELLESGYTIDELSEISDLLVEIEGETVGRHVTPIEVQKLVWLIRNQRSKRGLTLGEIEMVADQLTNFYRERGFILAKAYIPQQDVRDGIVNITMLLGMLGEVRTQQNKLYSDKSLAAAFKPIMEKPVTHRQIEEQLYLINDFPGVSVQGYFEPGLQVGDTRLNLVVSDERRFAGAVRLDNHGSDVTGEYRLYGEALWRNPLGFADELLVGALQSAEPDNSTFGRIRYQTNFFSPRLKLLLGASRNEFVLGPGTSDSVEPLDLSGETKQLDVAATYIFKRSRKNNYSLGLTFQEIESELRLGAFPDEGNVGLDDKIRTTSLVFNYDYLQEKRRILHQGTVTLTSGDFALGADVGQDESFQVLGLDYTLLSFFNVPVLNADSRIIVRTSAQLASSPLSSINQFSLAGPTRAKAFEVNQFDADDALFLGVEWIYNWPEFADFGIIGNVRARNAAQPFLFMDAAYGVQKALTDDIDERTAQLVDAGVGLKLSFGERLKGSLQLAFPLDSSFSTDDIQEPEDSSRLVFDLQYNFF